MSQGHVSKWTKMKQQERVDREFFSVGTSSGGQGVANDPSIGTKGASNKLHSHELLLDVYE